MSRGRRGERRARTIRRARARLRDFEASCAGYFRRGWVLSLFRFAKRSAFGCNCRKRTPGAPRRGRGDKADFRFRIYALRSDARQLAQRIVGRGVDPDGDEIALLCRRVEWR